MRVIIRIYLILFTFLIIIFIVSCYKENYKDHWPPSEVKDLKAEAGNSTILLTWTDPPDSDFEKVEIRYADTLLWVSKKTEKYEAHNLINDSTYRFTVRAADIDGNLSDARHAHAKPVEPPDIAWLSEPSSVLDTNNYGDLNGGFTMNRYLQISGGTGYIGFRINIIRLVDDSIVSTYEKEFLVYDNTKYRFEFTGRGDISIFNCTDCENGFPTYTAQVVSLADNETFSITPVSCIDIPVCNNGKSKKETRWNMISVKFLNLPAVFD